jgi:hypothetical protein
MVRRLKVFGTDLSEQWNVMPEAAQLPNNLVRVE